MRFRDALQANSGSLTDADRRVANAILTTRIGIAELTAAQLASNASVHESTVVRFAQKVGYDGYPQLRVALTTEFDNRLRPSIDTHPRLTTDRNPALAAVVDAHVELITELPRMIPQSAIDEAADIFASAGQVLVIGRGLMTAPATFMARKLTLLGVLAVHSDQGGDEAVERAALLRPGDAVLIFAFNDEYAGFSSLVSTLAARGVRGVLVADHAALLERVLPDVVLPVPRRNTDYGVMGAIMVACYAIEYAMTAGIPEAAQQARSDIAALAGPSHATARYEQILDPSMHSVTTDNRIGEPPQ
ncbi:DNA-binding transcriptional regulator, MurR/RpiR family, contains HTH and SIS domains [Rhodococcoides kyotonense]|uniref:DNA-binding transcriptional regulator, MurR/RpiR family, contains HTH and SIS domains n=2 Tax=Rhodococcoides kyotonense TaxID=398843 RepID=A0A239N0P9_9NOCA|nr:DNA-binding transcriptional regulator, MurR/RpiR family, contains HTH and SIS domains [Rhodococcus kyotonensis]